MNARNKIITIEYPIEAVKMNYLSNDQALAYGAIKASGRITRTELALIGVTRNKQEKVLGMLEALDRIVVDDEVIYYLPNQQLDMSQVAQNKPITQEVEECTAVPVQAKSEQTPSYIDTVDHEGPCTYQEIFSYLSTLVGDVNFKRLSDPSIDIQATAQKIFDYYDGKNWMVGLRPIKSWKGITRRSVGDNYPNPWALTQKSLKDLAAEADAAREAVRQSKQEEAVVVDALPSPERERVLIGLVQQKLGPRPEQSLYSNGAPFLTAEQSSEWLNAVEAYDREFDQELKLARAKFEGVETHNLNNVVF